MSDLSMIERAKLEQLFGMRSGYVLEFSNFTFSDFFRSYKINIDDEKYYVIGTSKANWMRAFWNRNGNYIVGTVIEGVINYTLVQGWLCKINNQQLINECQEIAQRLLNCQSVAELDALIATTDELDFELVAKHIRDAIDKNQPEGGLDRLHTFVHKFLRPRCKAYDIEITRDKSLNSVFGEYVKALKKERYLESRMTERILKSSISVLEDFNGVRNNKSLVHDNPVLNYEESLLIFNYIAALIRFIKSLEEKIQSGMVQAQKSTYNFDSLPF
ncbi:hypothetical protein ABID23_000780 [Bartonella silvatica]|uniref:Abortive infection protein-like C-terminal domain-containing protein n=1 Tax=Bartonella silvatica TaxID=357760 RepID=A0ABV2HGL5_9HYPH